MATRGPRVTLQSLGIGLYTRQVTPYLEHLCNDTVTDAPKEQS